MISVSQGVSFILHVLLPSPQPAQEWAWALLCSLFHPRTSIAALHLPTLAPSTFFSGQVPLLILGLGLEVVNWEEQLELGMQLF